jgi:hypothetical protein
MVDKRLLARAVVQARASLEEALKEPRRWPFAELHQLFEAVAAYTDASAGDEMIHRCVAGCVSGLHEYLADQGKHVPPDTVHEARRLEMLLFQNFDLPSDDQADLEQEVDTESEGETEESADGASKEDEDDEEDEDEDDEEDEDDDTTEGDEGQVRRDDEETPQ